MRSIRAAVALASIAMYPWLGKHLHAQLASFSPTDDARLHAAVVDASSGRPVAATAIRVLGEPELMRFTPDDVTALSDKTRLFVEAPVVFTDDNGVVSMDSPIDFPSIYLAGLAMNDDGYVVAAAPGAKPLASRVGLAYTCIEITNRTFVVNGKIHAGYLPALAVIPQNEEHAEATVAPQLNELTAIVTPPVVVQGSNVDLDIRWRYVAMPLLTSKVDFPNVELVERSGETGMVVEHWKVSAHPIGEQTGMQKVTIAAHLDPPHNTVPAMTVDAHYYVAGSQIEADMYQRVLAARELPLEKSAEVQAICRNAIREFPAMDIAWVELVRRLAEDKQWQQVRKVADAAPAGIRQSFAVASALGAAYEQLGVDDKRWDVLISIAASADAPAAARQLCFAKALEAKRYDVAKEIVPHLDGLFSRRQVVSAQRYLAWMSGEREVPNDERVWVAESLAANGELDEALVVLASVDIAALKDDYRRSGYFKALANIALDNEDLAQAESALASIAELAGKPVEKLAEHLLLGRLAEVKGDLESALANYARGYGSIDSHVEAFERALLASLARETDATGVRHASAALSLLAAHRFDRAYEVAEEALQRDPELPAAHLSLALAAQMTGHVKEAVTQLQQARALLPQNRYLAIEYERARDLAGMNEPHTADLRVWTDDQGRVGEAVLVDVRDGRAQLRGRNGRISAMPVKQLSERDQQYLQKHGDP